MRIIDNFDVSIDNYSPEFEEFVNSDAMESIEEAEFLIESLESEYGLESSFDDKVQKLWNIVKSIWNWILKKLKNAHVRMRVLRGKIKKLMHKHMPKIERIEGLINPEAIDHLADMYRNLIEVLKSTSKSMTVVTPNTLNELTDNFNKIQNACMSVAGGSFKKFHGDDITVEITKLNKYLLSLDKSCANLENVRKELMSVVFEINNKCNKTTIDGAQRGSGSDRDGFEVVRMMNKITHTIKDVFKFIDKFEEYIQSTIKKIEGKENPQITSGDESVGIEAYLGGANPEDVKAALTKEVIASIKSAAEEVIADVSGAKAVGKRKGNVIVAVEFNKNVDDSTVYKVMKKLQAKVKSIDHPANTKWECIQDDGTEPVILCVLDKVRKKSSGNEGVETKLVKAVIDEYGIEGVTSIIRNLSSK